MPKATGSIVIAQALSGGRGAALVVTGLLVLVGSAVAHATNAHLAAALVFGLSMAGLRIMARFDTDALGTPWGIILRLTDIFSLILLSAATFVPLMLVALGGHPGWDIPVLGGILLMWWLVLDRVVADYRRVSGVLLVMVAGWLPIVFLHPTDAQLAYAVAVLAAIALAASAWGLREALRGVPRYYRVIDIDKPE